MTTIQKNLSDMAMTRKVIRNSWNNKYATGNVNGLPMAGSSYKVINNMADYLARQNYSCGGPCQIQNQNPGIGRLVGGIPNNCDGTKIPPSTTNVKWVSDSSDYVTYRKQRAINQNNLSK